MLSHGSTRRARPLGPASPRIGGGSSVVTAGVPYLVPLPGAAVASASGILSSQALAAVAVSAIACALVRVVVEHARIEVTRDQADRWIGARVGQPPSDEVLLARIDELLSARTRTTLGRSFRRIAADAVSGGRPMSPAQLNRGRLRRHADDLVRLADRLEDLALPVAPRGVALAHRLVTAGGGPLYNARDGERLRVSLNATLRALDLDPQR
jgi:hypothetical protein